MYFTSTPSLNSVEAIMKKPPGVVQRGGGKNYRSYKFTKEDCDCHLCAHFKRDNGCAEERCPVMDIRIACGAAKLADAVMEVFRETENAKFQKRLACNYNRRRNQQMTFRNNRHQEIFEAERLHFRKPSQKAIACLYLLTSDSALWRAARQHMTKDGKVILRNIHLGDISTDSYALWKSVCELQTGKKQIHLSELADSSLISDTAFRLIVQAVAVARSGAGILSEPEAPDA